MHPLFFTLLADLSKRNVTLFLRIAQKVEEMRIESKEMKKYHRVTFFVCMKVNLNKNMLSEKSTIEKSIKEYWVLRIL